MSVFIKFHPDDMNDFEERVRNIKNKVLDVNSSTIDAKKIIREKRESINQAFSFVNEAHEELNKIISLMPQVDSVPLKTQDFQFRINPAEHHESLVKLSDKISKLR